MWFYIMIKLIIELVLNFYQKKTNCAYKTRKGIKNNIGVISARTFLGFYNIPFIETNKYKAEVDGKTKFIVINLKKKKK